MVAHDCAIVTHDREIVAHDREIVAHDREEIQKASDRDWTRGRIGLTSTRLDGGDLIIVLIVATINM